MVCSEMDPLSLWIRAMQTTSRVDVKWSLQLLLESLHCLISRTVMFRRRKLTVFFPENPYCSVCKSALKTNIMLSLFSARALLSPDNKHRVESVDATETKAELMVGAVSLVMSWQWRLKVCTLGFFADGFKCSSYVWWACSFLMQHDVQLLQSSTHLAAEGDICFESP